MYEEARALLPDDIRVEAVNQTDGYFRDLAPTVGGWQGKASSVVLAVGR